MLSVLEGNGNRAFYRWLLTHLGLGVGWDCATAHVYDETAFQHLIDGVADERLVFSNTGFDMKGWHPTSLKTCQRGEWNTRMLVEKPCCRC